MLLVLVGGSLRVNTPEPLKLLQVIARYGEVRGRLVFHRLIYELQGKGLLDTNYKFVNYSFGPYSRELEDDLKLLASLGLIIEQGLGNGNVSIRLSRKGEDVVKSLRELRTSPSRVRV